MRGDRLRRGLAAAVLAVALGAPACGAAQGFAGLGRTAEGFAPVTPGRAFAFPRDHAPHPRHRIEWWYVTANLTAADGTALGAQWTLFRQAIAPDGPAAGWRAPQVWMAHAAVTTPGRHLSAEKFARGGVGQAGVAIGPFRAWIDDWRMESAGAAFAPLRLVAAGAGFSYSLTLTGDAPMVLQGEGGYSLKSERGQASYYYSDPYLDVAGTVEIDGASVAVTGRAWFDREWSSQPLDPDQTGWDWFALHLPAGEKLMLYRMRRRDGAGRVFGTWIAADGTPAPLSDDAIAMRPVESADVAGRAIPVAWEIAIPSRGLAVRVEALNPQAWMGARFSYWEGPMRITGSHPGAGYMELTGR